MDAAVNLSRVSYNEILKLNWARSGSVCTCSGWRLGACYSHGKNEWFSNSLGLNGRVSAFSNVNVAFPTALISWIVFLTVKGLLLFPWFVSQIHFFEYSLQIFIYLICIAVTLKKCRGYREWKRWNLSAYKFRWIIGIRIMHIGPKFHM